MPISENEERIQEVIARLIGVWYRVKDISGHLRPLKETFWYYDGKHYWYTYKDDWALYPEAEFSLKGMDATGLYERIPDPRPK